MAFKLAIVEVTQSYLDNVFELHGFSDSITNDKDLVSISQF